MKFRMSVPILRAVIPLALLVCSPTIRAAHSDDSAETADIGKTMLTVFRERGAVPDNIDLTMEKLRESQIKGFFETDIGVSLKKNGGQDHGEHQHSQMNSSDNEHKEMQDVVQALVTKDGHYAAFGERFALGPDIRAEIPRYIRMAFGFAATSLVTVSDPVPSPFPGFNEIGVAMSDGPRRQFQKFYLTSDNCFLLVGIVLPLTPVSPSSALKTIDLSDQPTQGPSNAKVTLVEYGDMDCPKSAATHELIEKHIVPKYGEKVRIVFKDLPWTPIWSWTWQASLASQCAYQVDPSKFVVYRSLIFANQKSLFENAKNVEPSILQLADKAGLPQDKIAACVNSELSRGRIDRDVQEARILGIASTPTMFINGKMLIGLQTAEDIDKAIDAALTTEK